MGSDNDTCYGKCENGSKDENPISCKMAKKDHYICIRHGQMSTNKELRFRLNCTRDGSAYIRTQTSKETGGWQKAHFHKFLKETYIVEKGWIGYIVIDKHGQITSNAFIKGQHFTTIPMLAHNIYMPENTTIHTVKHGAEKLPENSADWFDGSEECQAIMSICEKYKNFRSLEEYKKAFNDYDAQGDQVDDMNLKTIETQYNNAYRHFDKLIWQVPALATGIFAIFMTAVTKSDFKNNIFQDIIPPWILTVMMFLLCGIFIFILSYTLYRFRCHQEMIKVQTWSPTRKRVVSPQRFLQMFVLLEALILIVGSIAITPLNYLAIYHKIGIIISITIGTVILGWLYEYKIKKVTNKARYEHKPKRLVEGVPGVS